MDRLEIVRKDIKGWKNDAWLLRYKKKHFLLVKPFPLTGTIIMIADKNGKVDYKEDHIFAIFDKGASYEGVFEDFKLALYRFEKVFEGD